MEGSLNNHPLKIFDKDEYVANVHDRKGASDVVSLLGGRFERLVKTVADGGYCGGLIMKINSTLKTSYNRHTQAG